MDDAHELIKIINEMAITLGRPPTRDEFCKQVRNGSRLYKKLFGTYVNLVQAASTETGPKVRSVDNSIFNKNIEKHLSGHTEDRPIRSYPSIASISDIHWPFCSNQVIKRFLEYCGDIKPEYIFINGDAWDMYSHTKFPRSHNVFTPREEQESARKSNELFWKQIKKRCPKSKCVQMLGNHDIRPMKRVMEVYPEAEDWIAEKLKSLFSFPGVKTITDPREEYYIDDIMIFHGYRSKLGDHRDYTLYNTINGHTHMGGVVFRRIRGSVIWELNSGLAGDPLAKGLTYTNQKLSVWTHGFGAVDKLGPRFIPA